MPLMHLKKSAHSKCALLISMGEIDHHKMFKQTYTAEQQRLYQQSNTAKTRLNGFFFMIAGLVSTNIYNIYLLSSIYLYLLLEVYPSRFSSVCLK